MTDVIVQTSVQVADKIWTGKVVRDDMVAVIYSPGFGAGWSTWDHGQYGEALIFDPMIVDLIEKQDADKLVNYITLRYPDLYTGGIDDLTIAWLPKDTLFRINEYDGSESIETMADIGWIKA
jgi:hypothetical protein